MTVRQNTARMCDIHPDSHARFYGQNLGRSTILINGLLSTEYTTVDMCEECFKIYQLLIKLWVIHPPAIYCDLCHGKKELDERLFSDIEERRDKRLGYPQNTLICSDCAKKIHDLLYTEKHHYATLSDYQGRTVKNDTTFLQDWEIQRYKEALAEADKK